MGSSSIFGKPGQIFGGPDSIFNKPLGNNSPPPPTAPPAPPDPGTITQQTLKNQVNQELQMRRSSALETGGQGVDGSRTLQTAGQTLLGA